MLRASPSESHGASGLQDLLAARAFFRLKAEATRRESPGANHQARTAPWLRCGELVYIASVPALCQQGYSSCSFKDTPLLAGSEHSSRPPQGPPELMARRSLALEDGAGKTPIEGLHVRLTIAHDRQRVTQGLFK
jgi:hypothetical protein